MHAVLLVVLLDLHKLLSHLLTDFFPDPGLQMELLRLLLHQLLFQDLDHSQQL